MIQNRVTQRDIANETGYSLITVSKALRDERDIAKQTKKVIQEAAKRLGYVKNNNASNLRLGSTKTIALIISDIINPLFAIIVSEVEIYARKCGYNVTMMNTGEKIEYEFSAVQTAIAMNVDGVLLFPCQRNAAAVELLKSKGIPYVLMGRLFDEEIHPSVVFDDAKGGYLATEFLLKKGYKRILMLNAPLYISSARDRYSGYLKAHHDNGVEPIDTLTVQGASTIDGCSEAIRALIPQRFDAVFAFNDILAFQTINALRGMGMSVPEDIGIVGFDDIMSVVPFPFPLTTISVPKLEIVHQSVDMLIGIIKTGANAYMQVRLDVSLVVRGSTR